MPLACTADCANPTARGLPPARWQATYTTIYSEDAAKTAATVAPGLQLQGAASIISDRTLMLPGTASIHLKNYGAVTTNPSVVPISGNATYIVEFKYRILSYGSSSTVVPVYLTPAGDNNQQHLIPVSNLVPSAPATGTFSAGGQTATASQYYFSITASADSDVIVDDIKVIRQDPVQQTTRPSTWTRLENLPFPRLAKLGKYFQGATGWQARPGMRDGQYSVDQIESRLAFNDVIAGLWWDTQTRDDPGSIRRLRQLNPNGVILPYRISEEQGPEQAQLFSEVSLDYAFLQSVPDEWYVKDTAGNYTVEDQFPDNRFMNISPFCPLVNGQTYLSFLLGWLNGKIFPSGLWDGATLDNFFAEANIHIRNLSNPALLDFDYNRNGVRDETPASISDMTRNANIGLLQQFQATNGDLQLLMGNAGSVPEFSLAPYMNGYLQECFSDAWSDLSKASPAGWRGVFDAYRTMQTISRRPRINTLEGCGSPSRRFNDPSYLSATSDDLRTHRLALGTTLLSDGFYSFDLHDNFTVPLWYDEYSVDAQGRAVEDRTKKGYLGAALTDAVELTGAGTVVLQESFDGGSIPPPFRANPPSAVSISNGALHHWHSSDHTKNDSAGVNTDPNRLRLDPGTYLLTFGWEILETLDHPLGFNVSGKAGWLDSFGVQRTVAGDFGTAHFPFAISTADVWSIGIYISGGGNVAIDNVRVTKAGAGPWRRDFENGFVLVNPFPFRSPIRSRRQTWPAPSIAAVSRGSMALRLPRSTTVSP